MGVGVERDGFSQGSERIGEGTLTDNGRGSWFLSLCGMAVGQVRVTGDTADLEEQSRRARMIAAIESEKVEGLEGLAPFKVSQGEGWERVWSCTGRGRAVASRKPSEPWGMGWRHSGWISRVQT